MNCESCGGPTMVVDSRTDADLEGRRIRAVEWALGTDALKRIGKTRAGVRLRLRRCADCGNEQATVELTAAQMGKI